ncbi:MAG TPA: DNA-directed RNA polymerase subunit beta [Firmicutes bacterium]|nr:DNA-directed RNA polymerase subunit beta [Bacillota bacterium]
MEKVATVTKGPEKERHSFGRIREVMDLPNLIEIQTASYERFLNEGLLETFRDISPIQDFTGNLTLEFVDYEFDDPKMDEDECRERDATYAAPLKVRVRLINKETGEVKEQEVFMGDFPLMTEKGTFIINGAERVVVSQLVRSAGTYFKREIDSSGRDVYSANIIPNRGAWLEFETDANEVVYVRVDRTRKIPVTVLLRAVGYGTDEEILQLIGESQQLKNTLDKDTTDSVETGLVEIYKKLRPGEPPTVESAKGLFDNLFFDPRRYDLAAVGRYKLNKKLGLRERIYGMILAEPVADPSTGEILADAGQKVDRVVMLKLEQAKVKSVWIQTEQGPVKVVGNGLVDQDVKNLTPDDMVATISYFFGLFKNVGSTDDIDHLGNRRLKTVGELLQNQFRIGLSRMERVVRERMTIQDANIITPQALINIRPVVAAIKEFFGSSQLSQFMDQTNPLSELTHKRRLSALGPGGLSRERAGFEVRDVHYSHYGRMCPIETPEGPNIGLIGSLCTFGRINDFGFIETPYRKVIDGRVLDEIEYLTADEEDKYVIAQANEPLDENGYLTNPRVGCRFKDQILSISPDKVDLMDVSPKQLVSVATALIPFLEHDDANRALMGSNMQRQAVPLLKTDSPLVGTGMEYRAAVDSQAVIVAKNSGVVVRATADEIVVKTDDGKEDRYKCTKFVRSNQSTCINQKVLVRKNQRVEKGMVLADGPATDDGELALGRNTLVAFMPWEGYNYEDAILISEKLVEEDAFTSISSDPSFVSLA